MSLGAVLMVGHGGQSAQEQLVLQAQRAATLDLIDLLQGQGVERIIVAAPSTEWLPSTLNIIRAEDPPGERFHFGARLAGLVEDYGLEPLIYFGGGSAPLVDAAMSGVIVDLLAKSGRSVPSHIVLTNNLHSSDWAAISHLREALPLIRGAERDNSLAWELRESGTYEVRVLAGLRPASSMDIDTPSDLAILAQHPSLLPTLRTVLTDPRLDLIPVRQVMEVIRTDGKTLALIGRVSPIAWQALNKQARVWTRVIAEERGMVASERIQRGEVRSMLVPWINGRGVQGFFADLSQMADAVLFDSRVLFAALGMNPSAADRYASDLLRPDLIEDPWLRDFTEAARTAPIPVVLGGHSVVAGGLHTLVEILSLNQAG